MKICNYFLGVCLGLSILLSCQGGSTNLTEEELQQYILQPDHGYVQEKQVGDVQLQLLCRPTDLLVAQELKGDKLADMERVSQLREKYSQYSYFLLGISKNNKEALSQSESYAQFSEQLHTVAFRMHDYVQAVTSANDTIPLADFHLARTYGMGGATQVLLAFSKEKLHQSGWLEVQVQDIGLETGQNNFRFETEKLTKEPTMKFELQSSL